MRGSGIHLNCNHVELNTNDQILMTCFPNLLVLSAGPSAPIQRSSRADFLSIFPLRQTRLFIVQAVDK